ncbi:MAG: single-stranded-DNA-specific exonuclease RecJ [Ginsengibacter sp.]
MIKRWKIKPADDTKVEALHASLKVNRKLCEVLVSRDINSFQEAENYFRPKLTQLHDPFLMKDMDKAVERILKARSGQKKILVFGDYDVDGTTSVACMYKFLRSICSEGLIEFYIPHRYREGYGVSKMGIDYAVSNGFDLIISLDCGIKSIELVAYAKELGIDFIICDHHLPDEILPPAIAILNPKQIDCGYPYKELCGCGVGFKLITALSQNLGLPENEYLKYLDLVATAIAADIVPITGENRILAFYGLQKINTDACAGIKALIKLSGSSLPYTINNVVFIIAPRVNAAGRMDDARKAVLMFVEDDYEKALSYAEQLHLDNLDRKEADSTITEEALAMIDGDIIFAKRNTTVVYKPHWHKGVVGIVASRLIEKYYRPTVVLTKSGDVIAGSARSIAGFNLYEAIHACRGRLIGYGGHFAAAGLTMHPQNLEGFIQQFEDAVTKTLEPDLLIPEILIDAEISFKNLTPSFYKIITQMEPYGPENMRPVFICRRAINNGYSKIVKDNHIRFVMQNDGIKFTGIGFNMAEQFSILESKQPVDIVFTLDLNEWNGESSVQLKVIDFKLSESVTA